MGGGGTETKLMLSQLKLKLNLKLELSLAIFASGIIPGQVQIFEEKITEFHIHEVIS